MAQLSQQQKFIVSELWILAWSASVQRAHVYDASAKHFGSTRRPEFRKAVIDFISNELLTYYLEKKCSEQQIEEQHYKNIASLIQFANQKKRGILGKYGYKYGVAQKLLNLMLKYLWCAGMIPEPPHCPVDRIVIDKTEYRGKAWTKICKESEYRKIIKAIKELS